MRSCVLCSSQSFYDEDGLYFCNSCGTQSQEMKVQVEQEIANADLGRFSTKVRELVAKKSGAGSKRGKAHDIGKVWSKPEGYQFLIKAIVRGLIKLGFNHQLKDVVKQIWFGYLQLCGIAFVNGETSELRFQRYDVGCGRRPKIGRVHKSKRKARGIESNTDSDESHPDSEHSTSDNEDYYNEDNSDVYKLEQSMDKLEQRRDADRCGNPLTSLSSDEDNKQPCAKNVEEECSSDISSIIVDTPSRPKKQLTSDVSNMKQHHTLIFCYLGLMWLQEPVFLCDLVRWCDEGHLPYHQARSVFPDEMKFSTNDIHLFCQRKALDCGSLYLLSCKLARCLDLDIRLGREYFVSLLGILALDLNIGEAIFQLANRLLDRCERRCDSIGHPRKHLRAEVFLAACIVVAMKLVYVLDDETEYTGFVRRTLFGPSQESTTPCAWTEWVTATMARSRRALFNGIPSHREDLKHVHDLSQYADYCARHVFKSFRARTATASVFNTRGLKKHGLSEDRLDQYAHMVSGAVAAPTAGGSTQAVARTPTSFPLSFGHDGVKTDGPSSATSSVHTATAGASHSEASSIPLEECLAEATAAASTDTCHFNGLPLKGYILYDKVPARSFAAAERNTLFPWHESYKFLMMVCAWRVKCTTHELQLSVELVEEKLFWKEIAECERRFFGEIFNRN